ncbi:hypothetical protein J2S49_001043 [Arcanobacterium wilhelmae]|uniref:Uncharacterized protein n=1 Tax=Arcanobacterium wilhelmae TaxID=1803177 RepID=A0ABT9NB86_9ACTO|nr:hypothetical protein [Arcanobacterium wilhelmae]MDP9800967.1 hypothetical protein [Arcanobacterium wilhelmae]WFN90327.1 hypothetical protein P8A24_00255 [Arcanobacterium wilhelmae]
MKNETFTVADAAQLADAIAAGAQNIVIEGTIAGSPSITLPEGATLSGGELKFTGKGVRLTKDNTLRDITISTVDYEVAVYNSSEVADAGTLRLENVTTDGQVYIAAEGATKKIRLETDGVFVRTADVRSRIDQPHGYGVDVLQGAFTAWNRQADSDSEFTATLKGISAGTKDAPVRGSGVFVAGYADREGKLTGGAFRADLLETGDVYSDGGIAPGTPDKITGGVFVVSGAIVDRVENNGAVTTYGQNDMVLDLWGDTPEWIANAPITSYGASGIGFVNFGNMGHLEVNAPIVTNGGGARGFNVYDGTMESAVFDSITTTGDGAIGIQVSKPMGTITVKGDVATTGGEGTSLVKGVQMTLKAIGVSIKPGADVAGIDIAGTVRTKGANLNSFEILEGAKVGTLKVGAVEADGEGSKRVEITGEVAEGGIE